MVYKKIVCTYQEKERKLKRKNNNKFIVVFLFREIELLSRHNFQFILYLYFWAKCYLRYLLDGKSLRKSAIKSCRFFSFFFYLEMVEISFAIFYIKKKKKKKKEFVVLVWCKPQTWLRKMKLRIAYSAFSSVDVLSFLLYLQKRF